MATWNFKGLDKYVLALEKMSMHTTGHLKASVYEGAKVVADNIKSALNSIPTQDEYTKPGEMRRGITSEQKASLISGFGLSKIRSEGSVNTKAGFSGSNGKTTNAAIARQVESGTSWMQKHPVIRRAANSSKGAAEAAMARKLDSILQQNF